MKTKINILHMIETGGPGGAENVLINLACNLENGKYTSIVILRKEGWLNETLKKRNVKTVIFEEKSMFDFMFLVKVINIIKEYNISVIHSHEFLMSMYATLAGIITRRPVITTIHGKYYYWEKRRRRLIMRLISKYSQIVSVSNELRYFMADKLSIKPEKIYNIYNGIDLSMYNNEEYDVKAKETLGIKDTCKIVLSVGNLYPVKGHIYLVRAIPKILNKYKNIIFIFAGRGEEKTKMSMEAEYLNIKENIMLLGFRSDIPSLLSFADIFVLPSLNESLPLSVLESLAMGTPVIATNVGGINEIIEDGISGFIVPPKNHDALAEKILLLLDDKSIGMNFRKRSREIINNKFSMETMIRNYEYLYSRMHIGRRYDRETF